MGIIIFLVVAVVCLGLLMNLLSSPETKLFRRVWSTERMRGQISGGEQAAAITSLMERHKVDFSGSVDDADRATGELLAAGLQFDMKHKNNLGVQVTPVLARELLRRIPAGQHPDLSEKLSQAQHLDVGAFASAMQKSISEMHPPA